MILAQLQNFEWLNDPQGFSFTALGLRVESKAGSDFWQNQTAGIHKDSGHFFYLEKSGNFTLDLCWAAQNNGRFNQCGIMLRTDENNWLKSSVMCENPENPSVASCATIDGFSDWAMHKISSMPEKVHYRLRRIGNDYILYFSLDGENFEQIRLIHLDNRGAPVLAGAYICSPQTGDFSATLTNIDFS